MKVTRLLVATVIVAALMAGFGMWVAAGLPAGTELPTHWNAAGEVDDSQPALVALLLPAGIALVMGLIFAAIPSLEPLQDKLTASAPVLRVAWIGMLVLLAGTQLMIAAPALGWHVGANLVLVLVGLLLVALGNVLPKSRPGFFVGVRTPWSIMDTDNWVATNRMGGKLLMLAGAAIVAASLLPVPGTVRIATVLIAVLAAALGSTAYSWWLWRQSGRGSGQA